MYTDDIDYSDYSTEYMICATPDLRYIFYFGLGAVVVAAALVMWVIRHGQTS
jgi:hypothetical protein